MAGLGIAGGADVALIGCRRFVSPETRRFHGLFLGKVDDVMFSLDMWRISGDRFAHLE
jgi:hypothetical protein